MKTKITLLFVLLFNFVSFSQTESETQKIIAASNVLELNKMAREYDSIFKAEKAIANQMAALKGWPLTTVEKNGGRSELIRLDEFGNPVYYQTDNVGAAQTTRANRLNTGGSLGLNLDGQNMRIGIWDGGKVRDTHLLLTGRVTQVDNSTSLSAHATHVGGTMMGNGTASASAKGMASQATLRAYDWNSDTGEVTNAAANGLLVSNHSYGKDPDFVTLQNWGKYDASARSFDNIMFNAPFYLFVNSAGNSRNGGYNESKDGYDLLSGKSTSKNGLIVAAVNQVSNYTGPSSVGMSGFSSWGPTDDGRIKPDISGKGVNVRSSVSSSNSAYDFYSGTSMSSPNVAGTLLLLQQHHNNVKGNYMRAATLRGLALHSADEAGDAPGPDYRFGWGLLNAEKAANLITNEGINSKIAEKTLINGDTYTFNINTKDATKPMSATICWTDPAGVVIQNYTVDLFRPSLVNDLDVRISKNDVVTYPWKLNPAIVDDPAEKADNLVDNIERIDVTNPSGTYTITVSHKNTLVNSQQKYSLIVSNTDEKSILLSTNKPLVNRICEGTSLSSFDFQLETTTSFSDTATFSLLGVPAGATASFTNDSQTDAGSNTLTISNLNGLVAGTYPITVVATSAGATSNLFFKLIIHDALIVNPTLATPADNATFADSFTELTWSNLGDNAANYSIDVAKDSNFTTSLQTFTANGTSLELTNLDFGTDYFWRVKALNVCDESEYSTAFKFTTACSNNLVVSINNPTINGATVTWTNPNAAATFEIEVVPQGQAPTGVYTTVTANSYTYTTLNSYSNYVVFLRSSCSGNVFSIPVSQSFSTLINHCVDGVFFDSGTATGNYLNGEYTQTTISPVNVGDSVSVTFTSFNIENESDTLRIFDGPTTSSPFIVQEYGFTGTNSPGTVTATNPTGQLTFLFYSDGLNTAPGWTATVSCANLATIKNTSQKFTYHPNPTKDKVSFYSIENIKSIAVYTILGQVIKSENFNAKEILFDVATLPAGNYFFKVTTENATKTIKIVKQ